MTGSRRRAFLLAALVGVVALGAAVLALRSGRGADQDSVSGRLDQSFGEAGIRRAPALGIAPADFVRLGDERVLAVGSAGGDERTFALAAYRSDGSLDRQFGRKGIVRTRVGTYGTAGAAVVGHDGRILVTGCASSRPGARDCGDTLVLARYQPDGTLDTSFGTSGLVTTRFPNAFPEGLALALQRDGKLVVAGGLFGDLTPADSTSTVSRSAILVLRYDARGRLDPSFGQRGVQLVHVRSPKGIPVAATKVAIQNDGKILLGESAVFSLRADGFRLIRLEQDGTLDPSFGKRGVAQVTLSRTSPCCSQLGSLLTLPDGRIVAVGRDSETKRRLALTRFTTTGALDHSFGEDGVAFDASDAWAQVVDVFAEGQKILAVGWSSRDGRYHYALRRFTSVGALDLSFGENGRVSTLTNAPAVAAFLDRTELLVAGAGDPDAPGILFVRYRVR